MQQLQSVLKAGSNLRAQAWSLVPSTQVLSGLALAAVSGAAVYAIGQRVYMNFRTRRVVQKDADPTHLFVLVPGYLGTPSQMQYLATRLGQRDRCVAMISTANCGTMTSLFRTLDGIDVGGLRLADEVRAFRIRGDMKSLESISFIGDGIGGLYARYAIGALLDADGEKLCGLKPGNYISLSTPHLGVRGCVNIWQRFIGELLFPTSKQMLLQDTGRAGLPSTPLLLKMTESSTKFMTALSLFKTRVTVSDADMLRPHITGQPFLHTWSCTAIASMSPATPSIIQRSSDRAIDSALYPHVIAFFGASPAWSKPLHIAVPEAAKAKLQGWLPVMVQDSTEHACVRNLNEVPWQRLVVHFNNSIGRQVTHAHRRWTGEGRDVVDFLMANVLWEHEPSKKIRVWVDGCFDLFHFGHANAFRQARALGDVLIVGIHTDEEVERVKGAPPLMKDEERYEAVRACKWVDELVLNVPYSFDTQEELQQYIDRHQIDYIVHGDDPCFTPDGRDVYEHVKAKGMFKAVKRTEGVSTTDIVGRMLTCGMEHFVDDEDIKGKRASDVSADDAAMACEAVRRSNFLPTSHRIRQFSSNRTPKQDDVVVYMDGAWDMFHQGHIAVLKEARKLGSFLLVGIQSDETVNAMRGQNLPIMNLHERALGVLSCRYVDEVIIGTGFEVTLDMIKTLNISYVVHGTHFDAPQTPDPYKVPRELGIFKIVASPLNLSVNTIISRVVGVNRGKFEAKFAKKSKAEDAYHEKKEYLQEL